MKTTNLTIRMDEDLRDQTKSILAAIGLDLTTAVNLFAKAVIRENGIPFPLSADTYGGDVNKIERRWAAQLKEGERQAAKGELRDFHEIALEIKRDYGLN